MTAGEPIDPVHLVPGKDDYETMAGLLSRPQRLGIRPIRFRILDPHPRRDAGCFTEASHVLTPFVRTASHALVVFDREGSGIEGNTAREIASDLEERLRSSGWNDRAGVVVPDPELEAWVWSDSPYVDRVLGWKGHSPALRERLETRVLLAPGRAKPERPREAMDAALREAKVQHSSSLFRQLAGSVSLQSCTDPAFVRLRSILAAWFPPAGPPQ